MASAAPDRKSRRRRLTRAERWVLDGLGGVLVEVLQDVALTNKLLRLVNTASYRHAGGGTISTVSRAAVSVPNQ